MCTSRPEHIKNVSYGANTILDGVSLNQTTRTKALVMPTELANLESLHCYLKVVGDFPVTEIEMTYKSMKEGVFPFEALPEKSDQKPSMTLVSDKNDSEELEEEAPKEEIREKGP